MIGEIDINTTPACIEDNFAVLEGQLDSVLERYKDLVVTNDGIKSARADAKELNDLKKTIAGRRKEAVAEASGPIRLFDERAKALEAKVEDTRQGITQQLKRFEQEKVAEAIKLVDELLAKELDAYSIREEFRNVDVTDMYKIGSLTAKGALTAAAKKGVASAVMGARALQDRTDARLSCLKSTCLEKGLVTPLEKEHVAGFLMTMDDMDYVRGMNAVIEAELKRQEAAQERARAVVGPPVTGALIETIGEERARQEMAEAAETEAEQAFRQATGQEDPGVGDIPPELTKPPTREEPGQPTSAPGQNGAHALNGSGKKLVRMNVLIEVEVHRDTTYTVIETQLRKRLAAAGIERSVKNVMVIE